MQVKALIRSQTMCALSVLFLLCDVSSSQAAPTARKDCVWTKTVFLDRVIVLQPFGWLPTDWLKDLPTPVPQPLTVWTCISKIKKIKKVNALVPHRP